MRGRQEGIGRTTSEQLHNANCYAYLKNVVISQDMLNAINALSPSLALGLTNARKEEYAPEFAYADLYTQFFTVVESNLTTLIDTPRQEGLKQHARMLGYRNFLAHNPTGPLVREAKLESTPEKEAGVKGKLSALDDFISSLYTNNNHILESTYHALQHIPLTQTPISKSIESQIAGYLQDTGTRVNIETQTPAEAGSAYGRFTAMISNDFKPQHTTSLATVRAYQHPTPWTELRFGTQGQRDNGIARVSPLFRSWLDVQERTVNSEHLPEQPITHVYFNNLGLDRNDMEGKKERELSLVLHQLEQDHPNVAVITLPADKGFMQSSAYTKTHREFDYQGVYNDFLHIAHQDSASNQPIKDFYISEPIRRRIFQDERGRASPEIEKTKLGELLNNSFQAMGIQEGSKLSAAERQAVWFHFIKFELTSHILQQLSPESVNFSCKDAIDRGGVSSAYFNLVYSIKHNTPMSREEFECALHAAPAMVKARGMNHHVKLIWNTIDAYINANYDLVHSDPQQAWLIEWRDSNCPHARAEELLKLRLEQVTKELNDMPQNTRAQRDAVELGLSVVEKVKEQSLLGVSGKRLLLETVTLTPQVILHPENTRNTRRYEELVDKLLIKYPTLQFLAGLMQSLIAIALYIPSFGKSASLFNEGVATATAAFHHETRKTIQADMKMQIQNVKDDADPQPNDAVEERIGLN